MSHQFARATAAEEARCLEGALAAMQKVEGFDVVVVCTGTEQQAAYWQAKLEKGRGTVVPLSCKVVCVFEDWNGGAGNGLGTLYAWQKASAADGDLKRGLAAREISCAIYHTAGKGTRLAPLPGAENNNKPGVKLPACYGDEPLTILESVVKQTGVYAASRKGRLSVFWGDQIFVPTVSYAYTPTAHADILCTLGPMPSAQQWKDNGLEKYGLVAVARSGGACQIEKVDFDTALEMTKGLGEVVAVGTSLGSFSVSSTLLDALTEEFAVELAEKKACFDSDPHWWMPATLGLEAYTALMAKKGVSTEDATAHHARIRGMLAKNAKLTTQNGLLHFLGPVDVGANAYWWDYGQLKLYVKNAFRLIEPGPESDAMRQFMSVTLNEEGSALSNVSTKSQSVSKSVLANVKVADLTTDSSVVVNCTAKKLTCGKNSVAYNVLEDGELTLADGEVVTDVFMPDGTKIRQRSRIDLDGGKTWKIQVEENAFSFEDVYKQNQKTDVLQTSATAAQAHADLANTLGL